MSSHKKILKHIKEIELQLKKLEVKQEVKIENKLKNQCCPKPNCTSSNSQSEMQNLGNRLDRLETQISDFRREMQKTNRK